MHRRRVMLAIAFMFAIAHTAFVPIASIAEPFLNIPRLPAELRRAPAGGLIEPSGWELCGSGASWGVAATMSATGIHGFSAAGARSVTGLRVQLSASELGVPFYHEDRVAVAVAAAAPVALGVVLDGRSLSIDGYAPRRGLGVGWIVRGTIERASFLIAASPAARAGEAALFPGGWTAAIGAGTRAGAVSILVEGRSAGPPRVVLHNRWQISWAAFGASVDVTGGALRIGIGLDGGPATAIAGVTEDRHLGWTSQIALLQREEP